MRWILAIAMFLVGLGWIGYQFECPVSAPKHRLLTSQWRRTVDGWEKVTVQENEISMLSGRIDTMSPADAWAYHPHPIVFSLLLAMLSTLVLVAFSPESSVSQRNRSRLGFTRRSGTSAEAISIG